MDPSKLSDWIGLLVSVVPWGLALLGFVALFFRRLRRAWRGVWASAGLIDHWGPAPADAIEALLQVIQRAQTVSELRMECLESIARIGVYICDPSGLCTGCNDTLAELFGRDREEMLGYGWAAAIVDEDRLIAVQNWERAISHGFPYSDRYRIRNSRTGEVIAVKTQSRAVLDKQNRLIEFVGWVVRVDGQPLSPPD